MNESEQNPKGNLLRPNIGLQSTVVHPLILTGTSLLDCYISVVLLRVIPPAQVTMYLRAVHAEADIKLLQEFIKKNPLGIFTTAIKSSNFPLIQATHIPFVLDVPETNEAPEDSDQDNTQAYYGLLRGHLARANPHAKALMEAISAAQNEADDASLIELPDEVMVLFNGASHHYVTPKFYVETKPANGKVVPTWNYSAVQAYGKLRIYCDSQSEQTSSFLQKQVEDLSRHAETSIMGYIGGEKPAA